jgi:hypothetical protein
MSPGHTVACHWAEQIYAGAIQPRASAVVEAAVRDEAPPPVVPVPGDPDVTTLGPPSGV